MLLVRRHWFEEIGSGDGPDHKRHIYDDNVSYIFTLLPLALVALRPRYPHDNIATTKFYILFFFSSLSTSGSFARVTPTITFLPQLFSSIAHHLANPVPVVNSTPSLHVLVRRCVGTPS